VKENKSRERTAHPHTGKKKRTSQDTYIQEGISTQDKTRTYEQDNNICTRQQQQQQQQQLEMVTVHISTNKIRKSMKSRRKMKKRKIQMKRENRAVTG
jgi:hypothetical protein